MLKIAEGETYVAGIAYHGVGKSGNAYSRVVLREETKARDKESVTIWLDGAPEISQGDSFIVEKITSWSVGRKQDSKGEWRKDNTLNVVAKVIPASPVEWTEEDGGNPFEDDGCLPF